MAQVRTDRHNTSRFRAACGASNVPPNITTLAQFRTAARALVTLAVTLGGLSVEVRRRLKWLADGWYDDRFAAQAEALPPRDLECLQREMTAAANVLEDAPPAKRSGSRNRAGRARQQRSRRR